MTHGPKPKNGLQELDDNARLISHYDKLAPRYEKLYENQSRLSDFYKSRQSCVFELLRGLNGSDALEVGCAAGLMVDFFLEEQINYVGVDISPGMVQLCEDRFRDAEGTRFSVGDMRDLDFPDCSFDVVIALGALEYIHDEQQAVIEMARVLKPAGTLLLSGISKWSTYNVFNRFIYRKLQRWQPACIVREFHTEREYRSLMSRAQMDVTDVAYFNSTFGGRYLDKMLPNSASDRTGKEQQGHPWLERLSNGFIVQAQKPT